MGKLIGILAVAMATAGGATYGVMTYTDAGKAPTAASAEEYPVAHTGGCCANKHKSSGCCDGDEACAPTGLEAVVGGAAVDTRK